MADELILRMPDGSTRRVELKGDRYAVGRATLNDLACPDDGELSRQHMVLERTSEGWIAADLEARTARC